MYTRTHTHTHSIIYISTCTHKSDIHTQVAEIRSDADWFDEVRQALMRRYEQAEIKTRYVFLSVQAWM